MRFSSLIIKNVQKFDDKSLSEEKFHQEASISI